MHKANLTWPMLMTLIEVLLRNEFLTRETSVSRTTYRLTAKGSAVLSIYVKLKEEVGPLETEAILAQGLDELREPVLAPTDKKAAVAALKSMRSTLGSANFRLRDDPVPGRSGAKYRFSLVAEGLNKTSYGFDILTHASESEVIRVFVKQVDSDISVAIIYTKSASEVAKKLAGSYSMELVHVRELKRFADLLTFHDALLSNGSVLMEADPSQSFEFALRELVQDESRRSRISVFTWRGSPVYPLLPRNEKVHVYVMTTQGSKSPPGRAGESVVPSHDERALLALIERAPKNEEAEERELIIFDSVSELLVSLGNERSQKFLKLAMQSLQASGRRSLFIMKLGYHDERTEQMVRALFSDRLLYDGTGLRLDKAA